MDKIVLSISVAYISLMVGMTISFVGEIPECSQEPFAWYLPIQVFFLTATPVVLGYLIRMEKP